MATKKTGKIKFFNATKGFGFIKSNDGNGHDVFVHSTGLADKNIDTATIKEDMKVEYEESEGKKGLCAINVNFVD